MGPQEIVINAHYRHCQIADLLQMAKFLASDKCFCVHIEKILGNPEMNHQLPALCGKCTVCKNDKLFPHINKQGTKTIILDLFVFGDNSMTGKPTLKNLVKAIKAYTNVQQLLLSGSRSRKDAEPVEIKKALFMLVAHGLLNL